MLSKLKSFKSRGKQPDTAVQKGGALNIEDAKEVKGDIRGMWVLHRAVTPGGTDVTVFTVRMSKAAGQVYAGELLYENFNNIVKEPLLPPASLRGVQCLTADALARHKTLKHPSVLAWLGSGVNSLGSTQLMTEPAVPLRVRLASRAVTLDELCHGVVSIATALLWLHQECDLAYQNVSLDGIYVTQPQPGKPARWVLGDFSYATPLGNGHDMLHHSMAYQILAAPEDILPLPPADAKAGGERDPDTLTRGLGSRDVYGLGTVIDHLLALMPRCEDVQEMRMDLLHSLVESVDAEVELDNTIGKGGVYQSTQGAQRRASICVANEPDPVEPGEDLAARLDPLQRDMSAVLDILDSVIEWIDVSSLPQVKVIAQLPHGYRALNVAEELLLWALSAMHRSPCMRPNLPSLATGEFLGASPFVRAMAFLSEGIHMADEAESAEGFDVVLEALNTAAYADVVEYIVPLLCTRAAFLNPMGDAVYARLLVPNAGGQRGGASADAIPGSPNGTSASFPTGTQVEARGLQAAQELNGKVGEVVGVDEATGRVMIVFDDGEQRSLRPANLVVVGATGGRDAITNDDQTITEGDQSYEGAHNGVFEDPPHPANGVGGGAGADDGGSDGNPLTSAAGNGVLNPMDYSSLIGGFVRPILRDAKASDPQLKIALFQRVKYLTNEWFDVAPLLADVMACLKEKNITPGTAQEELKAAACQALAPLLVHQRDALTQRQRNSMLQVLYKIVSTDDKRYECLRQDAVAGGVLAWGCGGGGSAVAACALVTALKTPDLLLPHALVAVAHVLACASAPVPPEEIVGVAIPLLSPLTLSRNGDVRPLAQDALRAAYAALKRSGGGTPGKPFPPTQPLPTPASLMKF